MYRFLFSPWLAGNGLASLVIARSPAMTTELTAWRGETVYVEADIRDNPSREQFALRRYRIGLVETDVRSFVWARIGQYGDALVPVESPEETASITAIEVKPDAITGEHIFSGAPSEAAVLSGRSFILRVMEADLPACRKFPFYAEVNSNDCLRAYVHFKKLNERDHPEDFRIGRQVEVTQHALALARQFGIEPVKQSIDWFDEPAITPVDVSQRMIDTSYHQLMFENNIAPPIIYCGSWDWNGEWRNSHPDTPYHPNASFLAEVEKQAPDGTMAWCADEPGTTGMSIEDAIERVKYVQKYAPRLVPMITTGSRSIEGLRRLAADLPIRYCIVQNEDRPDQLPGVKGSYFSCMAQGCGGSRVNRPYRTFFPVAVIEGDPIMDFQGAIRTAKNMQAVFVLYYKLNKNLLTCWDKGGLFDEQDGGNGDGTAMYVDTRTGLVIPSVRMMHWHIAQQQVEKEMILAGGR